eukprot:TRINITY_DN1117_c0_g1_i1.p1 TRINITY_DN1117_c0_g1~~TRINITY_DN1117_c0_g1_i1.p1  ORF type:complete len:484 (+),score=104.49 TRINITY_DN1117_c0_g1_i1:673-2124(+)
MVRAHGLATTALVLLLTFTCVFANRDAPHDVQRIVTRHSSRALVTVDAVDVFKIIKKLDSVATEAVNDFIEMMSVEPTADEEETIDASSSEAIPQFTFEPQLESAIVSSAPTASVAPSPVAIEIESSSPRARTSIASAMPSTNSHSDTLVSSSEIEDVEEETTVEETTDEDTTGEETIAEEATVEDTTVEETTVEGAIAEETVAEETTVEETSVEETTVETASVPDEVVEESNVPPKDSPSPQPPKQSPKPTPSPSVSASPSVSPSSSPTPSPSPSPKEKPLRTITFGYKGYTDSIVLLLPDEGENAEDMESFVDQLREEGFTRTKFIAIQPDDVWIRSKGENKPAWFDASPETIGSIRERQLLRVTEKVMKAARGRRPTIIGFGQGGGIALTAYMRYGVDGVVSACGGLPLASSYPREMTDDSKDSMALVIGGDHVRNGVERMQSAGREIVFLRTNQPKENGRFKENVIGYVVGVLNRAIAT